ncbi:hypothetical protein TNCV_1319151 [Trichonephila clavipes]|nr:hypothetical protein TNCV_1319151 [Trichonephila clavipes]
MSSRRTKLYISVVTENIRDPPQSLVLSSNPKYVLEISQALGSLEFLRPPPQCGGVRYATALHHSQSNEGTFVGVVSCKSLRQ